MASFSPRILPLSVKKKIFFQESKTEKNKLLELKLAPPTSKYQNWKKMYSCIKKTVNFVAPFFEQVILDLEDSLTESGHCAPFSLIESYLIFFCYFLGGQMLPHPCFAKNVLPSPSPTLDFFLFTLSINTKSD